MDEKRLQIISTLAVTVALLTFAFLLVRQAIDLAQESERVSPETLVAGILALANTIVVAAVARWLQQGAAQQAEKQAEKVQEAIATGLASGVPTNPVETVPTE